MSDTEIERLLVRVEANAVQFEAEMKKINRALHASQAETRKALGAIKKDFDQTAGSIKRSALMATTALTTLGISFGAAQLITDFREGEEAARRLEAVLKTTGHAAGLSATMISSWARELEESTGRSATEIQNAASQLATFTSIGRNEFLPAIEVANDMADVFGGDLKASLDAVARALDDPIEGFANLKKRGFSLTEQELKRATAHVKAGNAAAAQQIVLKNLSSQVSGTAAAVNTGLTKALNDLRRQAGDTFKEMADQRGTAAAIAALELASKSVVFLGDNMDVLLDAAQAIAVFMATRYALSLGIATAEMLASAVAAVRAKGAVEALNAAMAKNPYGLAALAVAGLVTGLVMLAKAQSDAEITAKAQAKAHADAQPATTELEKLVRKLATANDEETASIRRKIAAILDEQRLKAQMARNDYLEAKAEVASKPATANAPSLSVGAMPSGFSLLPQEQKPTQIGPSGNPIDTVQDTADLRRLRALAEAKEDAYRRLKDISEEALTPNTTPIEFDSKADKNAAKKAEARKRLLADLEAQTALEEAQLAEQDARVRELEREAEITTRIRALKDAGVKADEAATVSAGIQVRLDEARLKAREREAELQRDGFEHQVAEINENYEALRLLERKTEAEALLAAHRKTSATQAEAEAKTADDIKKLADARVAASERSLSLAREEHRLQVAQLSGNRALTKVLQDQAEIRDRTNRYRQTGELDFDAAEARAKKEVNTERKAATYGEHRDLFSSAFSDGIRAAMAGDLQGFLSNQFGNFADTMFQKAGEQIFDAVFGGVSAVTEGTSQGVAMAATVTPAIVGAGATAGATMGAAITAAGAAAAATMAAAIATASAASAPFKMLGFDEGGYTGPGGTKQPAGLVHKGEVVWSQKDVAAHGGPAAVDAMRKSRLRGYSGGGVVGRTSIMPQVRAAMSRGEGAGGRDLVQQFNVDARGSVLADSLMAEMRASGAQMATQAGIAAVQTGRSDMKNANRRARHRFIG